MENQTVIKKIQEIIERLNEKRIECHIQWPCSFIPSYDGTESFSDGRWIEGVEIELEKLLFPIVRNEGNDMINDLSSNFLKDRPLETKEKVEANGNSNNLEPSKQEQESVIEGNKIKKLSNGKSSPKTKEAEKT